MVERNTPGLGRKTVDYQPVTKAKNELRAFNDEKSKGEAYMNETREPFCGACFWLEFQQRTKVWEFQKGQNLGEVKDVEIPSFQDYAGKDKFTLLNKIERKNRRENTIDVETNYQCKKNVKHGVCISESKALISPEAIEEAILKRK